MRVRSTSTRQVTTMDIINDPGGTSSGLTAPGCYTGGTRTITDEEHPGFRNRKRCGEVIIGPLTLYTYQRSASPVDVTFGPHPYWGSRSYKGDVIGFVEHNMADPLDVSEKVNLLQQLALVDAYAKMNATPLLVGEVASDLGATFTMFKRPMGRARDLINKIRQRARMLKAQKALTGTKALANAWLEYQFGWKPVVMDMTTIVELANSKLNRSRRLVFRAGRSFNESMQTSWATSAVPGLTEATGTVIWRKSGAVSAGVIADLELVGSTDQVMRDYGLRARDLAPTFWETLPYSWVVDYAFNVQQWIQAITPNPNVTVRGSWVTSIIRSTDITSGNGRIHVMTDPATTYRGSIGSSTRTSELVTRIANPSLPTTPVMTHQSLRFTQATNIGSVAIANFLSDLRRIRH